MLKKIFSVLVISACSLFAIADEGMWLPQLLKSMNEEDMKIRGLKLNAEDLYSLNSSSIKDAIVSLGGFCTGEMISSEGLMLTNHHCGYDAIQTHSSLENNYLKDGFWAMTKDEELTNKGLSASFLISIEDVSQQILAVLNDTMTENERNKKIREISSVIIKEKMEDTHYNGKIKSFFGGNNFYLLKYETFKDIRLVGAPPSSIGKYGGDTDNWMWPRHTGDFALFRVYCAPDGTPAEYSDENVPYEPKHHLPIQLDGVNNGDYTMIFGFPGSTDRYLTSYGVEEALKITNPTIVEIRDKKLKIIGDGMRSSEKIRIQYAAKHSQISNYWKYFIGQSKGLKRMKVYDKKIKIEEELKKWISEDESRIKKYGSSLSLIEGAYRANKDIAVARTYLNEAIFMGSEIMYFSFRMHRLITQLPKNKEERRLALRAIKKEATEHYKNYNSAIDQELFGAMLELYYTTVPKKQHAPVFNNIENQLLGIKKLDFKYYAKNTFSKSVFATEEKFFSFLENPSLSKIEIDPAYKTLMSIYDYYLENMYEKRQNIREDLKKGERLFIAGIKEMNVEKKLYPDANSTMRVTYGNVGDYKPGDAMHYDYYTTIDGIFEKEDNTNDEFMVPEKLTELYSNKNYGEYADQNGNLRVNFISNNDITGGNSGSPVINAWGEIVGTAFDGNWEAMSGDIAFENKVQRTISVDIRYIMFIIDKFAGATHLIDEMTIAPSRIKNDE